MALSPGGKQPASEAIAEINPLKTKRVCFIEGFNAYRAVNTLPRLYKTDLLIMCKARVIFCCESRTKHVNAM